MYIICTNYLDNNTYNIHDITSHNFDVLKTLEPHA